MIRYVAGPDWLDPATLLDGGPLASPIPVVAAGLLLMYLAGAIALWSSGRRWSVPRTLVFAVGCVTLAAVTSGGVETWGGRLFSVFMFQQLTLMIVVPPLLVLGSPGTLLLRAVPHRGLGRTVLRFAVGALRSRGARAVLHPAVTIPLFLLAYYGLYLSELGDILLASRAGHLAAEAAFLGAGLLFAVPVLSSDPLPVTPSPFTSVLQMFFETGVHAFFGVIVMVSPTLLLSAFVETTRAAGLDPLEDQRIAGGLAWGFGEAPTVLVLLWVMHRWFQDDTRRAKAADRRAEVEGDPELDAYNLYLERLKQGDRG
ncbi:MAG: cytochrome c oxidase assembly protein [Micrococcales bacterium]|nr:cytochrome c oxidase assembly protein [Micrococcales bacterium]